MVFIHTGRHSFSQGLTVPTTYILLALTCPFPARRDPFELSFISDNWEAKEDEGVADKIQKGFKLNYNLVPCT